jgi:cytoskeletal protein CcmA (bactofilin family)
MQRKTLQSYPRVLCPLSIRMLSDELAVGVGRVRGDSLLPLAILSKLSNSGMRLGGQLALGMMLDELPVGTDRVDPLGGAPVLLLPAAGGESDQKHDAGRRDSCTDCDHRLHQGSGVTSIIPLQSVPTEPTMSDSPKRRLIDQIGTSPTFVAEGCRLTGDLEAPGALVVCGTIRGDGRVGGMLSMAAKAEWDGEIHAQAAVIAGKITGKLVIEEKLEVGSTAVIRADVVARSIAIAKGAVIEGAITVTSGQPVVQFEERRTA